MWQVAERSPKHRRESTYFDAAFVVIVCVSLIKDLAPSSIKHITAVRLTEEAAHTRGLHSTWLSDSLLPKLTLTEDSSTVIHVECDLTKPAWGHKRKKEKKKKQKNKSGRGGEHCYWATSHCWQIGFHPPGTSGNSKEHIDAVPLRGCEGAGLSTLITRLLEPQSASSLAFCQVLVDRWWGVDIDDQRASLVVRCGCCLWYLRKCHGQRSKSFTVSVALATGAMQNTFTLHI